MYTLYVYTSTRCKTAYISVSVQMAYELGRRGIRNNRYCDITTKKNDLDIEIFRNAYSVLCGIEYMLPDNLYRPRCYTPEPFTIPYEYTEMPC